MVQQGGSSYQGTPAGAPGPGRLTGAPAPIIRAEEPGVGPSAYANWVRTGVAGLLMRGPLFFHGFIITDTASDLQVFYDGINNSGRRLFGVRTIAAVYTTVSEMFVKPLFLEIGLFVDVAGAPDDIFVLVEPLREEQLLPRPEQPVERAPGE